MADFFLRHWPEAWTLSTTAPCAHSQPGSMLTTLLSPHLQGDLLCDLEDPQQPESTQHADPKGGAGLDGSPDHLKDAPHDDLQETRAASGSVHTTAHVPASTCTTPARTYTCTCTPLHAPVHLTHPYNICTHSTCTSILHARLLTSVYICTPVPQMCPCTDQSACSCRLER